MVLLLVLLDVLFVVLLLVLFVVLLVQLFALCSTVVKPLFSAIIFSSFRGFISMIPVRFCFMYSGFWKKFSGRDKFYCENKKKRCRIEFIENTVLNVGGDRRMRGTREWT